MWLLLGGAVIGFPVAIYDFFIAWGINHTIGSAIILGFTAILTAAVLAVAFWPAMPGWLWTLLAIGFALDIIGTGVVAYFLTSYWLLGFMMVAALGWIVHMFAGAAVSRRHADRADVISLAVAT